MYVRFVGSCLLGGMTCFPQPCEMEPSRMRRKLVENTND
jgi:hypothetical protein